MVEWRAIPGYEGKYEASSDGRIRSLDRVIVVHRRSGSYLRPWRGRTLKTDIDDKGYERLGLYGADGTAAHIHVHILVALAFLGPRPAGMQVCHNDGVSLNNRLQNLRYDTPKGNVADTYIHGTVCRGERSGMAKLDEGAVRWIRQHQNVIPQQEMAERFGVTQGAVSKVVLGATWAHVHSEAA